MIIWVTVTVLIAAIALFRFSNAEEIAAVAAVTAGIVLFAEIFIAVVVHMTLDGDLARFESLRESAAQVPSKSAEDVAGQVAGANGKLAAQKAYNRRVWFDPFIPDAWDNVKPIAMPSKEP